MGDYTIRARVEANCPVGEVRRWLDTPEGIAGWWSDTVEGAASAAGDSFRVTFPTSPVVFELVVEAADDREIRWHVPENPPWWRGTTIGFDLGESDGSTTVLFTHGGFDQEDPIIEVITPAWVRFLDNLVGVAESGVADPAVRN